MNTCMYNDQPLTNAPCYQLIYCGYYFCQKDFFQKIKLCNPLYAQQDSSYKEFGGILCVEKTLINFQIKKMKKMKIFRGANRDEVSGRTV